MKNKLTSLIITIITIFSLPLTIFTYAHADDACTNLNPGNPAYEIYDCGSTGTTNSAETVVGRIISTIIGILGIVAVVFIVLGGVQYMTSAGDPGKIKKAKDTILYACIGLAVAALAFAITQFAINAINSSHCTIDPATGLCI